MKYISSKDGDNVVLDADALSKDLKIRVNSCTASGLKEKMAEEMNIILENSLFPTDFPRTLKSFIGNNEMLPFSNVKIIRLKLGKEESTICLNDVTIDQTNTSITIKSLQHSMLNSVNSDVPFVIEYNDLSISLTEKSITINFENMKIRLYDSENPILEVPDKGSMEISFSAHSMDERAPFTAEVPIFKDNLVGVCNREWIFPPRNDEQVKRLLHNIKMPGTKIVKAKFSSLKVNNKEYLHSIFKTLKQSQNMFIEISILGKCELNIALSGHSLESSSSFSSDELVYLEFWNPVLYIILFDVMFIFAKYLSSSLIYTSDGKKDMVFSTVAREDFWDSLSVEIGNEVKDGIKIALSTVNVTVDLAKINDEKYLELFKNIPFIFNVNTAYLHLNVVTTTLSDKVNVRSRKVFVNYFERSWWVQLIENTLTCKLENGKIVTFCEFDSAIAEIKERNNDDDDKDKFVVDIKCLSKLLLNFETPEVLNVSFLSLRDFARYLGILKFDLVVKRFIEKTDLVESESEDSLSIPEKREEEEEGDDDDDDDDEKEKLIRKEPTTLRPRVSVYDPHASPSFVSVEENEKDTDKRMFKKNLPKVTIVKSLFEIIDDFHEDDDEEEDVEILIAISKIEINLRNVYNIEIDNFEYKKAGVIIRKKKRLTRTTFTIKDYNITLMTQKGSEIERTVVLSNDRNNLTQYYVGEFNGTISPALKIVSETKIKKNVTDVIVFLQSFYVNFDGKLIRFLDNFTKDLSGELNGFIPLVHINSITLQPIPSIKFDCSSSFVSIRNAMIDIPQKTVITREKSYELQCLISIFDVPGILLEELGKMSKIEILKDISMSAKNPICSLVRVIVSAGKIIECPINMYTGSGTAKSSGGGGSTFLYEFTKETTSFVSTLAVETFALGKSLYSVIMDTAVWMKNGSQPPVPQNQDNMGCYSDYGLDGVDSCDKGWFGKLYDKIPIFFYVKK